MQNFKDWKHPKAKADSLLKTGVQWLDRQESCMRWWGSAPKASSSSQKPKTSLVTDFDSPYISCAGHPGLLKTPKLPCKYKFFVVLGVKSRAFCMLGYHWAGHLPSPLLWLCEYPPSWLWYIDTDRGLTLSWGRPWALHCLTLFLYTDVTASVPSVPDCFYPTLNSRGKEMQA